MSGDKTMKIIAVGGGEISLSETLKIDQEIIDQSRKKNPRLLFIPTASSDSEGYVKGMKTYFGEKLGCQIDILYLLNKKINQSETEKTILSSDIIYVGGGNTLKMMKIWRRYNIDTILRKAGERGVVLSGISAGAICWFTCGSSDSRKFKNPQAKLIRVTGLNFVPFVLCPHYNVEADRKPDLKELMKRTPGVAIALDNCSAIEIIDAGYRILTSNNSARAYKVYWSNGEYFEEVCPPEKWKRIYPEFQ